MNKILIGLAAAVLFFALIIGGSYNGFVTKNTAIDGQWAQVETQYQRRFDLIPNLVSSTQGFLTQEKTIFEDLAKARASYSGAKSTDQKVQAAANLDSALSRLLVIVENYPTLKSNETVAKLIDELAGTENRINVERRRFNELVQDYNTSVKILPGNIVAGMFGFKERQFFKAQEKAAEVPKVELK